jgi:hypothetical protein
VFSVEVNGCSRRGTPHFRSERAPGLPHRFQPVYAPVAARIKNSKSDLGPWRFNGCHQSSGVPDVAATPPSRLHQPNVVLPLPHDGLWLGTYALPRLWIRTWGRLMSGGHIGGISHLAKPPVEPEIRSPIHSEAIRWGRDGPLSRPGRCQTKCPPRSRRTSQSPPNPWAGSRAE